MKNVWEQKADEGKGSRASAGTYFLYSVGGALVGAVGTILLQVVLDTLGSVIRGGAQLVPVVILSMFTVALMVTIDERIPSRILSLAAIVAAPLGAVVIYLAALVVL